MQFERDTESSCNFFKNSSLKHTRKGKTGPNAIYGDYSDAFEPDKLFIG